MLTNPTFSNSFLKYKIIISVLITILFILGIMIFGKSNSFIFKGELNLIQFAQLSERYSSLLATMQANTETNDPAAISSNNELMAQEMQVLVRDFGWENVGEFIDIMIDIQHRIDNDEEWEERISNENLRERMRALARVSFDGPARVHYYYPCGAESDEEYDNYHVQGHEVSSRTFTNPSGSGHTVVSVAVSGENGDAGGYTTSVLTRNDNEIIIERIEITPTGVSPPTGRERPPYTIEDYLQNTPASSSPGDDCACNDTYNTLVRLINQERELHAFSYFLGAAEYVLNNMAQNERQNRRSVDYAIHVFFLENRAIYNNVLAQTGLLVNPVIDEDYTYPTDRISDLSFSVIGVAEMRAEMQAAHATPEEVLQEILDHISSEIETVTAEYEQCRGECNQKRAPNTFSPSTTWNFIPQANAQTLPICPNCREIQNLINQVENEQQVLNSIIQFPQGLFPKEENVFANIANTINKNALFITNLNTLLDECLAVVNALKNQELCIDQPLSSGNRSDPRCLSCGVNEYDSSLKPIKEVFNTIHRQLESVILPGIKNNNKFDVESGLQTIQELTKKLPATFTAIKDESALLDCLKTFSAAIFENNCKGTDPCQACAETTRFLTVFQTAHQEIMTITTSVLTSLIQIVESKPINNPEFVNSGKTIINNLVDVLDTRTKVLNRIESEIDTCRGKIKPAC